MKIAVTGHRPAKLGGYNAEKNFHAIREHMKNFLRGRKDVTLISGGALGIDQLWIEVGLSIALPVIVALPFEGYDLRWPFASRQKYAKLLDQCQEVRYISEPGYDARKLQERNIWMVNECDELAAYWDGSRSGTSNCVDYAQSQERKVHIFNTNEIIS